jgi:hypothetical protein
LIFILGFVLFGTDLYLQKQTRREPLFSETIDLEQWLGKIAMQPWHLDFIKEDIKVFTRDLSNTPFKAYKAEMPMEVAFNRVESLLDDPTKIHNWMHATTQCDIVKEISDSEKLVYCVSHSFPFKERDFYAQYTKRLGALDNSAHYTWRLVHGPERAGRVRVEAFNARITLKPESSHKTTAVIVGYLDPSGVMPDWAVNTFIGEFPFHSFQNIRNLVAPIEADLPSPLALSP